MQADAINGFRDFRRVPVFAGGGVGARLVVVVKEVQYAAQVGDDAVVHVGRGDSDVAQGRGVGVRNLPSRLALPSVRGFAIRPWSM